MLERTKYDINFSLKLSQFYYTYTWGNAFIYSLTRLCWSACRNVKVTQIYLVTHIASTVKLQDVKNDKARFKNCFVKLYKKVTWESKKQTLAQLCHHHYSLSSWFANPPLTRAQRCLVNLIMAHGFQHFLFLNSLPMIKLNFKYSNSEHILFSSSLLQLLLIFR